MGTGTWFERLRRALRGRLPAMAMGRRPSDCAPGTWVFFPRSAATLNCGLAGIVEVASSGPSALFSGDELLREVADSTRVSVRAIAEDGTLLESFGGSETWLDRVRSLRRPGILGHEDLEGLAAAAAEAATGLREFCESEQAVLDEVASRLPSAVQEAVASRLIVLLDAAWVLEREFLGSLSRTRALCGDGATPKRLVEMRKVNSTLEAIDRMEVRGRDSAGMVVQVTFPSSTDLESFRSALTEELRDDWAARGEAHDLLDGAVTEGPARDGHPVALSFVRKVAEEVGSLGDNVAALRERLAGDGLLHAALDDERSSAIVLGHTRWASNGLIHEANAHPVDNASVPGDTPDGATCVPPETGRFFVALNGDVDNHLELAAELRDSTGRVGSPRVTTDTQVIALLVDRYVRDGDSVEEAFRRTVARLEGSAAVAMVSDLEPGRLFLSLRGSGQSLYVGLAPDGHVLSSEVYGLVHETSSYVTLDGETERVAGDRTTRGTIAVLDVAGTVGVPRLLGFDGAALDGVEERGAEITTRDVDRGDFPHFFRKEIEQSPESVARTLRGKFELKHDGRRLVLNLGEEILPESIEQRLRDGSIRRIVCAGQGTASIAAGAIAAMLREDLSDAAVQVWSEKASELSGFGLRENMSDTLIIAVTQSGSTADTNRAVDLTRRRGAAVIAVVNRRSSDITRRADGVFYTSDGRDVEMSVASTKAFHAQVAAGAVLSLAIATVLGVIDDATAAERAGQLRGLPDLLRSVLACDERIAEVAAEHAPTRRHWAIIGSGWNRIAAEEVRIKCSELCYKSISADTVEDKKHIDLSAESLMLVLASGNPGTVQGDLVKDVAIFQAHKALPIVFADQGDDRYTPYASAVVALPPAPPRLAMLANVMAGHLFAYHSARAIDEGARFLAGVRSVVRGVFDGEGGVRTGTREAEDAAAETVRRLRAGRFDAALEPRIAGTLPLLLHAATDTLTPLALESLGVEPDQREEVVLARLTEAVRELERPVDAIRHQAKIVTVGTSRTVERPEGPVFDALDEAGVELDAVPETSLSTVRAVAPALAEVEGWARYRIEGLGADGMPSVETVHVIEERGGVSAKLPSRAEGGSPLKGTKRSVVRTRRAFVGVGGKDGRTLLIVPMVDARLHCTALVLLHIRFRDTMTVEEKVRALGPRGLQRIVDGVTEADIAWTDALLDGLSPLELFAHPSEHVVGAIVGSQRG